MKKSVQTVHEHKHLGYSVALLALAIIISATLLTIKLKAYVQTNEASEVISLRENILLATKSLHKRAPVDPKTGDIYFPEAKLFVPYNSMLADLTYSYEQNGPNGEELSISSEPVFNSTSAELYRIGTSKELIESLPKLQSCRRGVRLTQSKIVNENDQGSYNEIVTFANGKQYYVYVQNSCQELFTTATALKNLQAY